MEPVLELRHLSKHYPEHRAVDEISLLIPRGAFYSLLGALGLREDHYAAVDCGLRAADFG